MTDHDGSDEQRRPFCVVGQACSGPEWQARIAELEAENGELTAASKRMYDKWMACFDAARKAEADREQTIQRVRELCAMVGGTAVFVRDVLTALDGGIR